MWSGITRGLPLALVATASAMSTWKDFEFERQHGKEQGKPAPWLSHIDNGNSQSYIVKLDCVGCPHGSERFGEWKDDPRDSSLLLNFTATSSDGMLLNGYPFLNIAAHPPGIEAVQVASDIPKAPFDMLLGKHIINERPANPRKGRKFSRYALEYEHTILRADGSSEDELLQFDVTAIYRFNFPNPGTWSLNQEGQKMVQIKLKPGFQYGHDLFVAEDIQLIDRKDRAQPMKMKCGRLAMVKTDYNPTEWDAYGKLGTWSRTGNVVASQAYDFMKNNVVLIVAVFFAFAVVKAFRRRAARRAQEALALDDEEAATLIINVEAPPEYSEYTGRESFEVKQEGEQLLPNAEDEKN
ncbi:hypothetical protein BU24DRAFT_459748 [Aaosphaeria arxii CBS 175.79]|uniref:Uncharacterized protein n=1 Tax=Aaosphaeria arxii CBS 175.79 TaxID=1450172 RepID=A0A6A5Y5U1_9PLEO|nr:uncharacterized protein BU24DRAFT_459748 [Aaosphaeria arxii CBS 175.79]KAF2020140.1 hypothetical protein BU24DRAFT_459748 [Aaosphaeria arxii CBS 175.79]